MGGTKFVRFLPKNQHTKRKFLNFENWTNGEPHQLAKIRVFKVDYFDSTWLAISPILKIQKIPQGMVGKNLSYLIPSI